MSTLTHYMVLTTIPIVSDECWGDCVDTFDSVIKDAATGLKCIVEWVGSTPTSLPANTVYDYDGIHTFLNDNTLEWHGDGESMF